jgi:hypothetical protein
VLVKLVFDHVVLEILGCPMVTAMVEPYTANVVPSRTAMFRSKPRMCMSP